MAPYSSPAILKVSLCSNVPKLMFLVSLLVLFTTKIRERIIFIYKMTLGCGSHGMNECLSLTLAKAWFIVSFQRWTLSNG